MNSATTVLSVSDVVDIRRARNSGQSVTELASLYNVGPRYIYKITSGEKRQSIPQSKTIRGFKNYEITPDGRIWSKTKETYIAISNGKARLTGKSGQKQLVIIDKLINSHFA